MDLIGNLALIGGGIAFIGTLVNVRPEGLTKKKRGR